MTPKRRSPLPLVGASGAIGGVMGGCIMLSPCVHVPTLGVLGFYVTRVAVPAVVMLGYWILLQLVGGFGSLGNAEGGVAFWAHVGGFAAGAILVLVLCDRRLLTRHPYHGWRNPVAPSQNWRRLVEGRRR